MVIKDLLNCQAQDLCHSFSFEKNLLRHRHGMLSFVQLFVTT